MDIDWDNAKPEHTHWCEKSEAFIRAAENISPCKDCIPRPTKPAEWDGEGLPPVGTTCEVCMTGKPISDKALIMGYFDDLVWMNLQNWDEGNCYSGLPVTIVAGELDFRPIRTKEQREREELVEIIGDAYESGVGIIASDIIAAGWTKP